METKGTLTHPEGASWARGQAACTLRQKPELSLTTPRPWGHQETLRTSPYDP